MGLKKGVNLMKKKTLLIFFIILMLLGINSFAIAGDIVNLSKTSYQQSELPYILVLKNGDIMAIWCEGYHFNAEAALYFSIRSKETGIWSVPTVAVKPYNNSTFPQLAMDDDGDVHVTYTDGGGGGREVYYGIYSNGKWSKRNKVYDNESQNDSWPRIEVEGNKIYIMWCYNYHPAIGFMDVVMVENEKGGHWPIEKMLRQTVSDFANSTSIHCDFEVKDGNIFAIWMDDGHGVIGSWNMYYNEKVDGDWKKPFRLNPISWGQYYPSLTVDDEGKIHVVYGSKNNPIWYQQKSGGLGNPTVGWSKPQKITNGGTSQVTIEFIKYAKGLLHCIVKQGGNVFYVRGLTDGRWADPVKIADGTFPEYFGCDVDSEGNVHAIWSDGPGMDDPFHRDVYYTRVELPGTPPTAVIKANPTSGLFPLKVEFDGSESTSDAGKIIKYEWNFGDGETAEGKKVSHTYEEVGTYNATLYVLDDNILSGSASQEIEVLSGQPVASFEFSPNGGLSPIKIKFDASSSSDPDGKLVSYDWDFGDGETGQGEFITHRYTYGGTFTVKFTVTDDDKKTDTLSKEITIYEKPTAAFTASPTVGIAPLEVNLDASESSDPDGEIIFYNWDFGDGNTAVGKQKVKNHTYEAGGTYQVICTDVDNDYYMNTTTQEITVYDTPFSPLNVAMERVVNKTLFFIDYINIITWEENPENDPYFDIVIYRIYRKEKEQGNDQFVLKSEVDSNTFEYEDRKFKSLEEADNYTYAVSAVDSEGRESFLTEMGGSSMAAFLQKAVSKKDTSLNY